MDRLLGQAMPLGSMMIDIEGRQLTSVDKDRLMEPLVAGVILFSRNFESVEQLMTLTTQIHQLRHPKLLIGVDHEGGRVQRFKTGFTRLPPMGAIGRYYQQQPGQALELAEKVGWVMATELLAAGVDFSFAPVVDLDYGDSRVIGDRAFDADPIVVGRLAAQVMKGMQTAGMASVAKHFPGHGYIQADSHMEVAVDSRGFDEILQRDIQPFLKLIEMDVSAVMPAHVCYPKVDERPAGFSSVWLHSILRQKCHFDGAIISDDLSMHAASEWGDAPSRVLAALTAGCDLVLLCNALESVDEVLAKIEWQANPLSHSRLIRLHGQDHIKMKHLQNNPIWQSYAASVATFTEQTLQDTLPL